MNSRKRCIPSNIAIAVAGVLTIAGCSAVREPLAPISPRPVVSMVSLVVPQLLPNLDVGLDKPSVNLGDVFIYDNPPLQWTVTSIEGPFVGWTNNSGGAMQTAWSPLLPTLRWSDGDSAVDIGQRQISHLKGKFFPLKKGNRVTYYEEVIYARPGATVNGYWQCDVGDQSEITVPAGKSQVWEILCLLNGRERRVMYYSEQIGSIVRSAVTSESGLTIRQLTGYARGRAISLGGESVNMSVPAPTTGGAK